MLVLDNILALIAPHRCLACGLEGSLLCDGCAKKYLKAVPERCYRCKAASPLSRTCTNCRRKSPLFVVRPVAVYDGVARELIHVFKFERAQAGAQEIAKQLAVTLDLPEGTIVCHIPTASSRIRKRGYDQAELLAKSLAAAQKKRHIGLLSRHGQTRQVGAKRNARLRQLDAAFKVRYEHKIRGANILLVDDVMTTGATMETAARVLKSAGAKRIYGIVFAQG